MTNHECQQQDLLREMHGDIKEMLAKQTALNGSVLDTKKRFDEHVKDSNKFRRRSDQMWFILNIGKWLILIMFGSGIVWKVIDHIIK